MNDLAVYPFSVVVLPAIIAAVVACAVAVGPLRRRAAAVDGVIAFALMLAFVLSFTRELDWNAILRQCMTVAGDDAPFEKWHRIGLAAIVLALLAPIISALGARFVSTSRNGVTLGATVLAAALSAKFVVFPGSNGWWQIEQGLLVVAAMTAIAACAERAVLWSAWITFAMFAALALLGGFASLAVMCAAVSTASFLIALLTTLSARRDASAVAIPSSGSIALVLGTLGAIIANCGRAYDQSGVPAWAWIAVAVLPAGSLLFGSTIKRAATVQRATMWRVCGVFVGALLLGAAVAIAMNVTTTTTS